ncbi:uncharacterized protein EI90DRAFT_3294044 [Cantharellus anzutake]|uniref:uncharacterized protein n=1 Tax=Cantharellus anzutake TaxID=1750568 RepID=UPI001903F3E6|nr:uncharacterized protein EI90DRAFT_3294044 [Cantharellus anzutake]KAF8315078.1 hypothetical protein EI90DRAFT_3294044 [Cantharellus anzutake]
MCLCVMLAFLHLVEALEFLSTLPHAEAANWNSLPDSCAKVRPSPPHRREADVKVIPETKLASIMESHGDVERRTCKDLIADALRQRKWDPLIRYAYVKLSLAEPSGEALHYYYNNPKLWHWEITEVGSRIFTLPICLRPPGSLGYPLADGPVCNYFDELKIHNYLSISAVSGIAGFLAAVHETMLALLESILGDGNCTREEVLGRWHQGMEGKGIRNFRVKFFERVIERAKELQKKWYVFMGTKLTSLAPRPQGMISTRIREERQRLEPPYFALGFDQYASEQAEIPLPPRWVISKHWSISADIRPFPPNYKDNYSLDSARWRAMLPRSGDEQINVAAYKLTTADVGLGGFDAVNKDHVFAVLSQRLCLDIVLVGAEAAKLAERSISHHMRLLTGVSDANTILYTLAIRTDLALGAARLLYHPYAPKGRLC